MVKILASITSFVVKCRRVWQVLKKPSRKEVETIAKVSAIGIAIIGFLGFFISIMMKIFE